MIFGGTKHWLLLCKRESFYLCAITKDHNLFVPLEKWKILYYPHNLFVPLEKWKKISYVPVLSILLLTAANSLQK